MEEARLQTQPLQSMAVHTATLTHFRNYASLTLAPEGRSVVLTGANGSGKTNILEAVSLLMPGRGLRGARLAQLQNQSPPENSGARLMPGWGVALEVSDGDYLRQFGTGQQQDKDDKRIIRLDGEPLKSQSDLARHFAVLWQTPQMDQLFTEGMTERRRFFDRLVACFMPEHAAHLAKYEYLMRERNRLLGQQGYGYLGAEQHGWLATLEHKMAESTMAMAAARLETGQALQQAIDALHPDFPKAELRLSGFAEAALMAGQQSALAIEEALAGHLASSRAEDAQSGRTAHGAHKMELWVEHRQKRMEAAYCSTGEQKALLLSLLLAQALAMKERQGRVPIMLLDEVVAHLDITRRQALFRALDELAVQAWLTGTDPLLFEGFASDALYLQVESGRLK